MRNEHVVTEVVEKVKARVDTIAVVRAGSRWQNTCVFPMFDDLRAFCVQGEREAATSSFSNLLSPTR